MYLSKLELHGFKSFASPTVLQFDPGITAIVGPNGCGKSNIVDAVRWVIGEQRARILRSEKMENVIFNGTARRRPLGMAEVQLTIENTRGVLPTEYSEVTIGRRLYRSGDSEYLLNGVPCRLKDIVDLFMDTGMGAGAYSVIELKMIEEILSENAADRRHLFEEAAGVTKYKQRRAQALRKLDTTQADLTRLRDLTEEIEKRVRSLKRQADRAAKYREYADRLHHLELALARIEYERLQSQQEALQLDMQRLHDDVEEHSAQLARDEAELEALRASHVDREQKLSTSQQALRDHLDTVRRLEADLRLEQERMDAALRDRERTRRELEEATTRRDELLAQAERLVREIKTARPEHDRAEGLLREATEALDRIRKQAEERRGELQALRRQEHQLSEKRAEHRRQSDRLGNRLDLLDQEKRRVQEEIAALGTSSGDLERTLEQARGRVLEAEESAARASHTLEATEQELRNKQQAHAEALQALHQLERKHDAATAEVELLESLVTSFDEFPDAVQYLAGSPSWSTSEPSTVADLLGCDDEHRVVLDAALGELASCLVVETESEAYQAMHLLRAEQKGRATFVILERLRRLTPPSDAASPGDARPIWQLVRSQAPEHDVLPRILLRGCYLVDTLEKAKALAGSIPDRARFFTPNGEWVESTGIAYGGSEQSHLSQAANRFGRREQLQRAREHQASLKEALDQQRAAVEALEAEVKAVPFETRRRELQEAQRAHTEASKELERLQYRLDALAQRRGNLEARLAELDEETEAAVAHLQPLQQAAAEVEERLEEARTRREAAEEAYHAAEAATRAAQDEVGKTRVTAVEARNRLENLQRDLERTRSQSESLDRRASEQRTYLDALAQTIDTCRENIERLQEELTNERSRREELDKAVAGAKAALMHIKVEIDQVELRIRKLRRAREQAMQDENTRAVRRAEIQTRLEDLLENVSENYGLALAETDIRLEAGFDEASARAEVHELRAKIKGLGNVNPLALEEYEQESERLAFMTSQKEDLEQAESTLLQTIDEINTTAAERFQATFESIRTSFCDLFTELFGNDAAADLRLADPDDPLESAIEIAARPRGKRPVSIAQLSSGEKTLTAIALLFAIYLVKPSPFCILDEVDAPLDDANIDRFMRLIRRFASDTQFILVTHNKRTMELADRLYGITMQEQGVSRLVGVKFDEAVELAG